MGPIYAYIQWLKRRLLRHMLNVKSPSGAEFWAFGSCASFPTCDEKEPTSNAILMWQEDCTVDGYKLCPQTDAERKRGKILVAACASLPGHGWMPERAPVRHPMARPQLKGQHGAATANHGRPHSSVSGMIPAGYAMVLKPLCPDSSLQEGGTISET